MKSHRSSNYYFGIVAMAIGAGGLAYSIVSRDPSVFGKLAVLVIIGIVLFVRELRPKKPAAVRNQKPSDTA